MKRIVIEVEFEIGNVVYLKVDTDCEPGMVTGYSINPDKGVLYFVTFTMRTERFFGIELSHSPCHIPPNHEDD